jgi:hypothetical protein
MNKDAIYYFVNVGKRFEIFVHFFSKRGTGPKNFERQVFQKVGSPNIFLSDFKMLNHQNIFELSTFLCRLTKIYLHSLMSNLNPQYTITNLPADINKEIFDFLDIEELAVLFAVGSNAKFVCLNGLFNLGDTTLKLIEKRCYTNIWYDKTKKQSISHNGKWNRRKVLVAICSANYGPDFIPSPYLL